MIDAADFAHELANEDNLTEVKLVVRTAWFLSKTTGQKTVNAVEPVRFLADWSIRPNINMSRLKGKLRKSNEVSYRADGTIQIPMKSLQQFDQHYAQLLAGAPPQIKDSVLDSSDFVEARTYVKELVRQVNGSFQFQMFDACAVMMRRLAEVLIIDAFSATGNDSRIRGADGNLLMLNGLIGALKSGHTFKLSRNAPGYLETLKLLGDNAAHSRNYITKRRDIEEFSQKFRMIIHELRALI